MESRSRCLILNLALHRSFSLWCFLCCPVQYFWYQDFLNNTSNIGYNVLMQPGQSLFFQASKHLKFQYFFLNTTCWNCDSIVSSTIETIYWELPAISLFRTKAMLCVLFKVFRLHHALYAWPAFQPRMMHADVVILTVMKIYHAMLFLAMNFFHWDCVPSLIDLNTWSLIHPVSFSYPCCRLHYLCVQSHPIRPWSIVDPTDQVFQSAHIFEQLSYNKPCQGLERCTRVHWSMSGNWCSFFSPKIMYQSSANLNVSIQHAA